MYYRIGIGYLLYHFAFGGLLLVIVFPWAPVKDPVAASKKKFYTKVIIKV